MDDLLRLAFREASRLPTEEQEALAPWILAEIAAARRWQELLGGSADRLLDLAAEAAAACRSHTTRKRDPGGP